MTDTPHITNQTGRAHSQVTSGAECLQGRLELFFLPGYSPELNPDEWVWKNVKHDDIKRAGIQRGSELFGIVTR